MFRKMPFILLAMIALACLSDAYIPYSVKSVLYAVSLSLKEAIIFCLPFLIFGLLFKTTSQLSRKGSKFFLLILAAICTSNFISTLVSYSVGTVAYQLDLSMSFPEIAASLSPAWDFTIHKLLANDTAMFSGLLLGIFVGWWKPILSEKISVYLEQGIACFLKGFLFVIPFFILGFVVKMNYDQVMTTIISNYALVFFLVACAVFSYVAFLYLLANHFQAAPFIHSIKNMLPPTLVGFGSMSSAAAMPLTILGTEKNCKNSDLARFLIPATVNIHLIGDCFAIPIFAFAVLKNFGAAEPAFFSYLSFAAYFVLAKFSVAAVPGGGILVMLPILESSLGFNAEMLSLITGLYILFDPIITSANIMGNGAFAMVIDKLQKEKNPNLTPTELVQTR